jgi:hypothetical protein
MFVSEPAPTTLIDAISSTTMPIKMMPINTQALLCSHLKRANRRILIQIRKKNSLIRNKLLKRTIALIACIRLDGHELNHSYQYLPADKDKK